MLLKKLVDLFFHRVQAKEKIEAREIISNVSQLHQKQEELQKKIRKLESIRKCTRKFRIKKKLDRRLERMKYNGSF